MYFACNRSLKGFKLYDQSEGMLINFQSYKNIVSACEICYVYLCREAGSNIHTYTHVMHTYIQTCTYIHTCMHTSIHTYIHAYMHACIYASTI
jgi:hypothetical protein